MVVLISGGTPKCNRNSSVPYKVVAGSSDAVRLYSRQTICARTDLGAGAVQGGGRCSQIVGREGHRHGHHRPGVLKVPVNKMARCPQLITETSELAKNNSSDTTRLRQLTGVTAGHFDVGEIFNPKLYDAIGLVDSDEIESGRVAEEVQRGYRWTDEVARPARVRVAQ